MQNILLYIHEKYPVWFWNLKPTKLMPQPFCFTDLIFKKLTIRFEGWRDLEKMEVQVCSQIMKDFNLESTNEQGNWKRWWKKGESDQANRKREAKGTEQPDIL